MIPVTPQIELDERELVFDFVRASGPGGQNVNKVETAVQLRFDARNSPALNDYVRGRLNTLAGRRMTRDGVIVIQAQRFRTQEMNRSDAIERLVELIREAAFKPKTRRPTKPTKASKTRRLDSKAKHGALKKNRRTTIEM
ncbi:alternative ribosome rescue aminoacyl-tRNA hydrolase ArfB [Terrarubrum flagellatum]|uniref:alternative ribosome rescue aminoacyl-tRNA hydrolase ArfB n=1 Tax=Terrirubrum flagellatum TaxID=2895980 RepID=UPI00314553EB